MDGVRWLDEDEQRAWRAYLEMTLVLQDLLDRDLQRQAQIPLGYYEILVRLSEAPDRTLRMSELASATKSSRSRLSHAVARLEEYGWVERQPCATDRRGAWAHLTDEGLAVLERTAPCHVSGVREYLFDALSGDDVRHLETIARKVLDHLASPACPSNWVG